MRRPRAESSPGAPSPSARRSEHLRLLHELHGRDLLRYVHRHTGDVQLAEDIVQETLARVWKNPRVLEGTAEAVRPWLFTVARNLVIDDRRRARRLHERSVGELPEKASEDDTASALDRMLICEALESLSPDHRTVVVDAYYLGRTVTDIAARLQIPEGTVKSRLHYGLRALRLALQERGVTR
ncbi:sigma-70 family RNA polymerase sigma factor [Streptomyces winkii]|uniref:sigma-70 family RNA polymerase sigma factor n=1 Tax=Streptomyces winkii TaxID=3051178 RepID=UPI0028D8443D|nr:sigma-70 family RNA polymerase sigma factor [Streptomyces sp. DSM 40971]